LTMLPDGKPVVPMKVLICYLLVGIRRTHVLINADQPQMDYPR
jgi:hypothetical protein